SKRERFRRVCPVLKQKAQGVWVCGVDRLDVRPFWGRAGAYVGGAVLGAILLLAILVYSVMRGIGYQVTWRQVLWPPAWSELRAVRADLFIKQAREKYAAGEVREAIQALSVAHQLNPAHYQVAMLLAQFYQAGSPQQSDRLYFQLLQTHPDRRDEIAQDWFQGLLARGRLDAVAELAHDQLAAAPEQAPVWTNALLFAARHLPGAIDLAALARKTTLPIEARAVMELAAHVRNLPPEQARTALLETPAVAGFPYDRMFRADELIRLGYPQDALRVVSGARHELGGRDIARLAFAAYAKQGNRERLRADFLTLLAVERKPQPSEVLLLAVHLVRYPDAELAALVVNALPRLSKEPTDVWLETALAVFCAAGVSGDKAGMDAVKQVVRDSFALGLASWDGLELYFLQQSAITRIELILPSLNPLPLELNYALLDRYVAPVGPPAKR
ncbi:MAG: hypothetical protein IT582_00350, partial [Opitutaceae bacterium]|nr:hypothetical protein [Opitutaceae bacterium]